MDDLTKLTATELVAGYRARAFSPVEVTRAVIERVERLNPKLNAIVTFTPDLALTQAAEAERAYRQGNAGPLAGVPISIKDLTPTKGIRTTRGALFSADWVPDYDAPFVERVYNAGAIMLGKSNTPELGWKGESTNRVFGSTHNPWRYGLTPGGSSGGAAAAVAFGLGPLAQGSDGAGSIRIPASFSGIFGHKPSFGLVPQYPPSAVGDVSHLGPMTRSVADAALLMNVTAGADSRDRFSWSSAVDYLAALDEPLPKLRIAYSRNLGVPIVEPDVAKLVDEAVSTFRDMGHEVVEATPDVQDPYAINGLLWAAGMAGAFKDNLSELRESFDPGRLAMIDWVLDKSAVDVAAASYARNSYVDAIRRFMSEYDLLLTPTLPLTAFPAGLDAPETVNGQVLKDLSWTPYTYPFNLTGQPAASVPCGFTSDGLPVGLQIVGRFHDDAGVLRASAAFETARPWRDFWPDEEAFLKA
jgi:aspartyl-tRNA(Asn)/glutamyl-tRNA(Gln) amidotransferase subunit A